MKYTLAHVTHEAVEKIGGIGTVLEGLLTSPVYQKHVRRTILVGPTATHHEVDPAHRLGLEGTVLYSAADNLDTLHLGPKLRPIEWAFNTPIIYGTRTFSVPGDKRTGVAEVLMLDVFRISKDRLGVFKHRLAETFGIDSMRYEQDWGYEEYVRLAEPAFYALSAVLGDADTPCVLFAHEYMGMPAALKAVLDGGNRFRTVFHAHECSTARTVVERHDGHDTMFYNVLPEALRQKKYMHHLFGAMQNNPRNALIRRSHMCDAVVAVGRETASEMHFLGPHFDHHQIDVVYNGVPTIQVSGARKKRSRKMLADYAQALTGYRPSVLMTHVMRPVVSKGLWRDLRVCHELEARFEKSGETGVLFVVTSGGGTRRPQDVRNMESEYGWPRKHREGYPDLVGPEVEYGRMIEAFNTGHRQVQAVLVNQFGWSRECVGERLPAGMDFGDLRIAADVEFGMAVYEPFGISPLEPLCAGAICVISNVCGCAGYVEEAAEGKPTPNVVVADFTQLDYGSDRSVEALLEMTREERDAVELRVSAWVADELMKRLPRSERKSAAMLASGRKLAEAMGWDRVVTDKILPMLKRITNGQKVR